MAATQSQFVISRVTVKGTIIRACHPSTESPMFDFDSLLDAGWIRVTSCGEENVYFEFRADDGTFHKGFCKCL